MVSDIHTTHVHVQHTGHGAALQCKKTVSIYTWHGRSAVYEYARWDPVIVYEVASLA